MLLVIDVGNTNTVLGLMNGREVVHTFRISTTVGRTTDENGLLFLQLFAHYGIGVGDIEGAILSSVVPSVVYGLEKACKKYLHVDCMVVGRKIKTGMKVRTDNPKEVGADRIVNAVAAVDRWGAPIIVVDFGTATTVDCVNEKGEYVGGAIAPGFQISADALFARTAKLPRIEIERPPHAIGTNTVHAMQSGLFYGYLALVDGLVERCRDELVPDGKVKVVATGGFGALLASESHTLEEFDPNLTLTGLALLYERNVGG